MKKLIALLIIVFLALASYAQIVILDVINPAPRIGENIPVTFVIKHIDKEVEFSITHEEFKESIEKNIGKGTLTLEDHTTDAGRVVIGPLTFEIDGQIYKSDTLILDVYPKLPNEKNGFWTRFLEYQGDYYLITEQRISGKWKHKKESNNSFSMTFDSVGADFAEIPDSSIKRDNIEISFSYSSSRTQTIDADDVFGAGTVNYKLYVYRIYLKDDYNNDFILKKKHFKNFPKGQDFEAIEIIK